ncbi:MAG: hypothetical protein JKY46_05955 [Robiginitomaculum sp.]|nr:hypothetical protein [Robiginitomaculum sp.]
MKLDIKNDDKCYNSDSIENGRIIKDFFQRLSKNIFEQAKRYDKKHHELTKDHDLSLLYSERVIGSTISCAINEITPVHLSEWGFNKSEENTDANRRVDFWCLHKRNDTGKALNYFLEIKKSGYKLEKNFIYQVTKDKIKELLGQVQSLKGISPEWLGDDDAFIGIIIVHGYCNDNSVEKDIIGTPEKLREHIYNEIDKRSGAQLLISTWMLPDNIEAKWGNDDICKFVSIAGLVITKKR